MTNFTALINQIKNYKMTKENTENFQLLAMQIGFLLKIAFELTTNSGKDS